MRVSVKVNWHGGTYPWQTTKLCDIKPVGQKDDNPSSYGSLAEPNDRLAPDLITTSGENGNISQLLTGKEFTLAPIANLQLSPFNTQVSIATELPQQLHTQTQSGRKDS